MVVIPFRQYPRFQQDITLDGTLYVFAFSWNTRQEFWSLTILDKDENVLLAGIKITVGIDLIRKYSKTSFLRGSLIAFNTANNTDKIKQEDMGNTTQLIYVTEAELAAN